MEFVLKMPDVGEGVAEAELVEWHVNPGDPVREDMVVAAVMTDKATVEIPSPVTGMVTWLGAEVGDKIAVKGALLKIEVARDGASATNDGQVDEIRDVAPDKQTRQAAVEQSAARADSQTLAASMEAAVSTPVRSGVRQHVRSVQTPNTLASPAVRLRALDEGIDLRRVRATGPAGRVTHEDLDRHVLEPQLSPTVASRRTEVEELKVTGLRRRIAERMTLAASRIPHITYVEEIDMTGLEELRASLNREKQAGGQKLTVLPFLMKAICKGIDDNPVVNAHFDDEKGIVSRHRAVHVGIATQTPSGLMVPVVTHVEARGLRDCALEMTRVTQAARDGSATRKELTGSTITVSSLGSLGGLVSTPIINHPEVAIVGVNKLQVKPHWDGTQFTPRKFMNLSSSFDHRIVDGWDAATFVQRVKALLETPAMIFLEG